MNLEQQVTSLELSKKLKELGVKQESLFYWGDGELKSHTKLSFLNETRDGISKEVYSSFTVAELGQMLPEKIVDNKYSLHYYRNPDYPKETNYKRREKWSCGYEEHNIRGGRPYWRGWFLWEEAPTEADSRAKLLIYLLEKELITL